MSPLDVREYVNTRPFQPFRLTLTDGRTIDVRHPEMAMVGFTSVVVGLPPEQADRDETDTVLFERAAHVSLNHIMQIEPIDAARTQ